MTIVGARLHEPVATGKNLSRLRLSSRRPDCMILRAENLLLPITAASVAIAAVNYIFGGQVEDKRAAATRLVPKQLSEGCGHYSCLHDVRARALA